MKKGMSLLISLIIGCMLGIGIMGKKDEKSLKTRLLISNKNLMSFRVMTQWVKVKQEGKNLSEYFERAGYKKIAIYGMGYIGEALLSELSRTETKVLYGIDQNADTLYANIDIVSLDDELPEVDVIVITLVDSFESISEKIHIKIDCPVISIVDIVFEI